MGVRLRFMQFVSMYGCDHISITEHSILPDYNKDKTEL
jgi:hypothetical protein